MTTVIDCDERQPFDRVSAGAGRERRPANAWLGSALHRIAIELVRVHDQIASWQMERQTIRELSKLDDHMLRDIGVSRADLPGSVSRGDLRGVAEMLHPFLSSDHRRKR